MDSSAGKIWTDEKGMTLYTFDKDEAGKSNCYDKCATAWPPLAAAADATAEGEWTVVDRTDGTKMWAYEGHPLYTYVEDKAPGEVTGDGKGGESGTSQSEDLHVGHEHPDAVGGSQSARSTRSLTCM